MTTYLLDLLDNGNFRLLENTEEKKPLDNFELVADEGSRYVDDDWVYLTDDNKVLHIDGVPSRILGEIIQATAFQRGVKPGYDELFQDAFDLYEKYMKDPILLNESESVEYTDADARRNRARKEYFSEEDIDEIANKLIDEGIYLRDVLNSRTDYNW